MRAPGFQFIALTPAAAPDPAIAIAACRAGALGVLNLEYIHATAVARRALAELARYTDRPAGLKLDGDSPLIQELEAGGGLPAQISTLLVTARGLAGLAEPVAAWRRRGLTLLIEVTEVGQAELARQLGADGLIAKGNEAGGWVGEETTFVLLQRLLAGSKLPIWAYGGIGIHAAAACYAAGAAGVVLETQFALARESRLPEAAKTAVAAMDGSETICLGADLGHAFRAYQRPGSAALQALEANALELGAQPHHAEAWRRAVEARVGWGSLQDNVWPLDQAAAFARPLAERYRTVGGILGAMREALEAHTQAAARLRPLDAGSPLAASHNTRYPIAQGPMTRVSDRAEFALHVAEGGGLPFVALALMRAPEVEALLDETRRRLDGRPWGVGILGFVPQALRQEQLEVVRRFRPAYALIAGGRPDQARRLEAEGIATYLHVPSPGLLRLFLQDGARRFVFEGRECGGHVGPRSSFVLWDTMVDVLLEALPAAEAADCHILFAGGLHDQLSAAMLATLAAPLAERGVRLGVLMGTAYLFTREAVSSGAIGPRFQQEALRGEGTVLVESGPGYATRCLPSPFVEVFNRERQRLRQEGRPAEEIRNTLEELNVGRLRLASKGLTRHPGYEQDPTGPKYRTVDEAEQYRDGMYMIGQVAALRRQVTTIADLHHDVAVEGTRRLAAFSPAAAPAEPAARPAQIAIVGMSALLPKARSLREFWANILNKVEAIQPVPRERWDADLYYDPDRSAADKIYSRAGGFLDDLPFDPLEFGIPPASLPSIDPLHLLGLLAARDALADAGYAVRPFDRSRASVILGASGGTGDLGAKYLLRSGLPLLFGEAGFEIARDADGRLPQWTEDSFAGLLLNVAAGRIANRFDFGGLNYVVDAACASSLAALHLAVKELETHATDIVIAGGVDTVQNPFGYLCFSKTQALSPSGQARVFDAAGDGIVISEGVVMLVLKRLADAERDGDRIYAVIAAVEGSSDGRALGLTAPRPEGQALALERAYAKAGFSPTTVGLFEAHGTGTVVGDRTEASTLSGFLKARGAPAARYAIGSVKSMIGHTKATAGVAGVAKVAAALYHKVLPPTLGVTQPNPKAGFGDGPLYVNTETRPWLHGLQDHPRRAGVSAFGFGGTNFHAVLEEYTGDYLAGEREAVAQRWPSELLLWSAPTREALAAALAALEQALARGARPEMRDLAFSLWQAAAGRSGEPDLRLAVVASSPDDLRQKLAAARQALERPAPAQVQDPRGIYLAETPLARAGRIAFLFPGQGSQYPNMLRDLAVHFAPVRETLEQFDRFLRAQFPQPLSSAIFPPPAFTPEEERAQQQALTRTEVAQPALGAADTAIFRLLAQLGVRPDLLAGHSYGEYAALCAAGVLDPETLAWLSEARGRAIVETAADDPGTMAAVRAEAAAVAPIIESIASVWVANLNAPTQTIISGTRAGIAAALERLRAQGLSAQSIAVACAFHSPLMEPAQRRLAQALARARFLAPRAEVFSNTTAASYPSEPEAIRALLAEHLVRPVRFADQIEAMYAAGARVFVEAGPGSTLTSLAGQVLSQRPHLALAVDLPRRDGLTQLQHALGQLAAHGAPVQLDLLFTGRGARRLKLDDLERETQTRPLPASTWLVNGSRARPLNEPAVVLPPLQLPATAPATSAPPPGPAPLQTLPAASLGDEAGQVVAQFQQVMEHFLETQRSVMLAYLQGAAPPASTPAGLPNAPAAQAEAPAPAKNQNGAAPPTVGAEVGLSVSAEQLTAHLLRLVSERTGYPPDLLDLDVDIEANLGIDSIKRVEILGLLQRGYLPPERRLAPEAIEQLTAIKTLRGIAGWLAAALASDDAGAAPHPAGPAGALPGNGRPPALPDASPEPAAGPVEEAALPRALFTLVDAPPAPEPGIQFEPGQVFLITDDGRGIAAAIGEQIRARGGRAIRVGPPPTNGAGHPDIIWADLADPAAVDELAAKVRQAHGSVAGLIHLLPLRDEPDWQGLDLGAWRERLRRETKGLAYLARAFAPDLRQAGTAGRAWLLAATALDLEDASVGFPGQAGLAGLVKSLALEWPRVACKVVHLGGRAEAGELAGCVFRELAAGADLTEVAYTGARRRRWQPQAAPLNLEAESTPALAVEPDWVVLITGGARGITAEVAGELAERFHPTLLLIGSSPPPAGEEPEATAGLNGPAEIKAALMEQMRRAGETVAVPQVEARYQRLLKEREMRRSLARMAAAGAQVSYHQVDVRDERALRAFVEDVYRRYGRLDGVIHGAGVIEDRLIEAKTPDSFDRVFDPKVEGALSLSRVLRPDSLKFLALFASAAGPFGNRGQADYAAANEVLNRLAVSLDKAWPGRVVALNWGPWATAGMVSPELQREFARRKIQLIAPPAGSRAFVQELRQGRKGEAVVLLAGGEWGAAASTAPRVAVPSSSTPLLKNGGPAAGHFPLLHHASFSGDAAGAEVVRVLDPAHDLYLADHQLDGKPVFPFAMALELMAETAQRGWPGQQVAGLRDMQVLKGVVIDGTPPTLRVVARPAAGPAALVQVEIQDADTGRAHYRAAVELAAALPPPPPRPWAMDSLQPFPMSVDAAYTEWLFHGPLFQGLAQIEGISPEGLAAVCAPAAPGRCLAGAPAGGWLIDPVVFDSALQMIILWTRHYTDATPLPSRFDRYRRFGPFTGPQVQCYLRVPGKPPGPIFTVDIAFVADGVLAGLLEGMECPSSPAFNRLAGRRQRA